METLKALDSIQEQIVYHYETDPDVKQYIEVINLKKGIDIWNYINISNDYIYIKEGAVCLEEVSESTITHKSVSNAVLLFQNEIYDLEGYFTESISQKTLITLTSCQLMLIKKTEIENILKDSLVNKLLFQEQLNQTKTRLLKLKVKWGISSSKERLYDVLDWCIQSTEGNTLPRYITQKILAKMTNNSREYTNLLLKKLQKDNLIKLYPIELISKK